MSNYSQDPLLIKDDNILNNNKLIDNHHYNLNLSLYINNFFKLFSNSLKNFIHKVNGTLEKTEKENILFIFLSNLFMAISSLFLKIIAKNFPNTNGLNISFYRFISINFFSYMIIRFMNKKIVSLKDIDQKYLFFYRIGSTFIFSFALANSIYYLRYGTAIALSRLSPLFSSIFSVFFLKEKCLLRYFIGLSLGMLSVILFSYGDLKNEISESDINKSDLFFGLFWSFVNVFCHSSGTVINKILVKDIEPEVFMFYLSIGGLILSVFFILILQIKFIYNINFILLSLCHGFFHFLGMFFNLNNIKSNQIILISCFSFLPIFYAFIFGILFFEESITLLDFFGFSIMLIYSLYNVLYPPKKDE